MPIYHENLSRSVAETTITISKPLTWINSMLLGMSPDTGLVRLRDSLIRTDCLT